MTILFSSDSHFSHAKIIEYCQRPFANVEEMNEGMISRWNNKVTPADTVFHLGDFGFGPPDELRKIRDRLNGRIFLVPGNHDRKGTERLARLGLLHYTDPAARGLLNTWIHLSHKPVEIAKGTPEMCLNGHVHTAWKIKYHWIEGTYDVTGQINVGVDQWDFEPITMAEISVFFNTFYPTGKSPAGLTALTITDPHIQPVTKAPEF